MSYNYFTLLKYIAYIVFKFCIIYHKLNFKKLFTAISKNKNYS